jgi:hypothetical protein
MASASPREQMQNLAQSATDGVRSSLTEQKDTAASSLGSFAGALRKAARESDGGGQASTTRMAEWAADGLERISTTLRNKDMGGMLREAESFARSQPVAFFFAAAAAGFLATRFLKAGTGTSEPAKTADFPSTPRM